MLALIGAEALAEAQDECGWNGLGSTRVLVDGVLDDETGEKVRVVQGTSQRWVLKGWPKDGREQSAHEGGAR